MANGEEQVTGFDFQVYYAKGDKPQQGMSF
jgi:hypothetical protein